MFRRALLIAGLLLGAAIEVSAQDGANVLLVINTASGDSEQIGTRYARRRGIPETNVVRLKTTTADEIDRAAFEYDIVRPISEVITHHALQDQILYVVLTKGIPLRVGGTGGMSGTVASVDSELTLLYQRLLGAPVLPTGRLPNPYFLGDRAITEAKPFSHAAHDIYLVTRLDGFSVSDVFRLIEDGFAPARDGIFVLDQRANILAARAGDAWLDSAADRLRSAGLGDRVLLESSKAVVTGQGPVLGYYSWGSNDPAVRQRRFDLRFGPGSLAGMFVSTDGRTFKEPPQTWTIGSWQDSKTHFAGSPQSLMGDLIREGATGVAGHVAEPYLDGSVRPQIVFPGYVAGLNLAESFYLAMPYLSWQNVIVGDPLCAPFRQAQIAAAELAPLPDPDTELPRFFSERRLAVLRSYDVRPEIARLMLKASARLLHADLSGAARALEAVTEIEPALNAAHFVLATIYDVLGEYDRAIDRYKTVLTTAPADVRALNNLAYSIAVNKKDPISALRLAERAYDISHNTTSELVLDVGYAVAARKGTPANVLPFAPVGYYVAAIKGQIADTVGWIHHLLGNEPEAIKFLTQARDGSPANAEVQFHVAVVTAAMGRLDAARAALERAVELDPKLAEREDVKQLRARLPPG